MFTEALFFGSFALGAIAQSSSFGAFSASSSLGGGLQPSRKTSSINAQTTMNLFIDGATSEHFVGAVVAADSCETTYALVCTAGTFGEGYLSQSCDPSVTYHVTYGPNSYGLSTAATSAGTAVTLVESCSLTGTTEAACTWTAEASAGGEHTKTSSSLTYSGTNVHNFQVPITAGANKLQGLASCTSTGNAAAPTAATDVYKVLIVPGAAALLAAGFV